MIFPVLKLPCVSLQPSASSRCVILGEQGRCWVKLARSLPPRAVRGVAEKAEQAALARAVAGGGSHVLLHHSQGLSREEPLSA